MYLIGFDSFLSFYRFIATLDQCKLLEIIEVRDLCARVK